MNFKWELRLAVDAGRLWRYVADRNAINEAVGLAEWKLHYVPEADGGSRRVGESRLALWNMRWDEYPFEWVENSHFRIVRRFHNGPLRTLWTGVTLVEDGGTTLLTETVTIEPRSVVFAPALYLEIHYKTRRNFERVYRKIEKYLSGESTAPFEPPPPRPLAIERVEQLESRLTGSDGADWLPRLIGTLEELPDTELDRMRAYAFADRWGADRGIILSLFLEAAANGLLELSWDVLCPSCRGAKARTGTLRDLRKEAHCDACNIRYTADFAESVEVTFKPSPRIRRIDVAIYCSGGPMNAPHVVIQQVVPPGESRKVPLTLGPWRYRIRSLKIQNQCQVVALPEGESADHEVILTDAGIVPEGFSTGPQGTLTIRNASSREHTVMLEREAERGQATTAAMVTRLPQFRRLFADEVLSPDTEISAGMVTILFTDLRDSTAMYEQVGDTRAYRRVRDHFETLGNVVETNNGTFVKTIGDAVMAVFGDPSDAVRAAFRMHESLDARNEVDAPPLALKIGIHQGTCFAVTMNDRLDYFGTTVNVAARVQKESRGGDIIVTESVYQDPAARHVIEHEFESGQEAMDVEIRGLRGRHPVLRLTPLSPLSPK
jgi:class 3 adenylate cyclase